MRNQSQAALPSSKFDYSALDILIENEYKRKGIHLFALTIPIGYYFLPQKAALMVLIPVTLISIALDFIRILELPGYRLLNYLFGPMLRVHEEADLTGGPVILFATVLSVFLFAKPVALTAISFIILGDISSALIGRKYGVVAFGDKTLEGSLGFFLACLLVVVIIPDLPLLTGLAGAAVATLVEAIDLKVDDNLTVPLISGLIMELLLK